MHFRVGTQQRLDIFGSWVGSRDSIPGLPDSQTAAVDVFVTEDLSETWVGISWGYGITGEFGIGATQYATFRYHTTAFQARAQDLHQDGSLGLVSAYRYYDYANWRMLWKMKSRTCSIRWE